MEDRALFDIFMNSPQSNTRWYLCEGPIQIPDLGDLNDFFFFFFYSRL